MNVAGVADVGSFNAICHRLSSQMKSVIALTGVAMAGGVAPYLDGVAEVGDLQETPGILWKASLVGSTLQLRLREIVPFPSPRASIRQRTGLSAQRLLVCTRSVRLRLLLGFCRNSRTRVCGRSNTDSHHEFHSRDYRMLEESFRRSTAV